MIVIATGNILYATADALVNPVNIVGVAGAGLARQFKRQYPTNYVAYVKACEAKEVHIGAMFLHGLETVKPRWIINFPTKKNWRAGSHLTFVERGLTHLVKVIREIGIGSVAIPALGCGLGELRWSDVRPRIESAFESLPDINVLLFEPKDEK